MHTFMMKSDVEDDGHSQKRNSTKSIRHLLVRVKLRKILVFAPDFDCRKLFDRIHHLDLISLSICFRRIPCPEGEIRYNRNILKMSLHDNK